MTTSDYVFTEKDAQNTLLSEYPFFFVGMTLSEFESEQKRYAQFLAKGGCPPEYIPLKNRKGE